MAEYNKLTTLGAKGEAFEWCYNSESNLEIVRQFEGVKQPTKIVFTSNEISQLLNFIRENGEVDLANSVSKVSDGTEKKGLGTFLYNNLNCEIAKVQATSQFVAVMVHCGVLSYNGALKGMKFWINDNYWQRLLS